jgi:NADPH:quinone reductase-like Zn-dependent oxidoreductase
MAVARRPSSARAAQRSPGDTVVRVGDITDGKGAALVLDGVGGKNFSKKIPIANAFGVIVASDGYRSHRRESCAISGTSILR